MKSKKIFLKRSFFLCFICTILIFTGCSPTSLSLENEPIENTALLTVGRHLEINNTNENLILSDYKDALAGDGLYYASWEIKDTANSYNAQLYLLLGEFTSAKKAQENKDTWLEKGKSNYEISAEEEITCNGQTYLMITYTFQNKENPYTHGMSAFGVYENSAVCIELTAQEDFAEDLETILTDFLKNCTYK